MTNSDDDTMGSEISFETWMRVNKVLQAYADALDRADIAALLALFTPDAIWDYSLGTVRQGHDAIRGFFEERLRAFERTSHNVSPPTVRRGSEKGAYESTAYFMAAHLLRDGTRYTVWGRYVDVFRLVDSGLLISRRGVIAHVTEGTSRKYNLLSRKTG